MLMSLIHRVAGFIYTFLSIYFSIKVGNFPSSYVLQLLNTVFTIAIVVLVPCSHLLLKRFPGTGAVSLYLFHYHWIFSALSCFLSLTSVLFVSIFFNFLPSFSVTSFNLTTASVDHPPYTKPSHCHPQISHMFILLRLLSLVFVRLLFSLPSLPIQYDKGQPRKFLSLFQIRPRYSRILVEPCVHQTTRVINMQQLIIE